MIGALVALTSLQLTQLLVGDYNVIAQTLPITNATMTTPIVVTSANHNVAPGNQLHAVVSGVGGTIEANGLWILTPVDPNNFSLTNLSPQGLQQNSVGVNAYTSGGQIQTAFPDGRILLGRRNIALSTSVASPRIVFIPTRGRAWGFEPYGASPGVGQTPPVRGTVEHQSAALQPQRYTEFTTFEVHVTASATTYGAPQPSPDSGDFDAVQAIYFALMDVLYDAVGGVPRAKILAEHWPSQDAEAGTQTQRGQKWVGILEFQQPVITVPGEYVQVGTYAEMIVQPFNPGSTDPVEIIITQDDGP